MPIINKVSKINVNQDNMSSKGYFRRTKFYHPAVGAVAAIHAAITLTAAEQDITTNILAAGLDFARTVTIKPTKAGGSAITGDVVITGTNIRDEAVTDTITCSTDTTVVEGVVAFKTITKIHVPARQTASDAIEIGTGTKLGLDRICVGNEVLMGTVDGVREGTMPIITADTTIGKNVVLFNTTLANTKTFVVNYVTTEITADKHII